MSDWHRYIVDLEADASEAPALAARLDAWLVDERILDAQRCTVHGETFRRPGNRAGLALVPLAGCEHDELGGWTRDTPEAPSAGRAGGAIGRWSSRQHVRRDFWPAGANEVSVSVQRGCWFPVEPPWTLACPACGVEFEPEESFTEAIGEWYDRHSDGPVPCPACGHIQPIVDWDGPSPHGVGEFALNFMNWPPLSDRFIGRVADLLGHRVRVVYTRM
ncbi:MAG: hypothetical protein ACF8QF_04935 [Phycisphaerales bacterium]